MNPTKLGAPYLDTPSSKYEFLKFSTKSRIINKENRISTRDQLLGAPGPVHPQRRTVGAHSQRDPNISDTGAEHGD